MKSKLRKKSKTKNVFDNKYREIFEQSFIRDKKNKRSITTYKEIYIQSKNNIIVSKNFNLVYFEDDYFEDIEKYLTKQSSQYIT